MQPIKEAAYTIKRHWDSVVNWKKSHINNGILEGINSVIQAIKSRARGFCNVNYFCTMAYLITANFDFSKINKFMRTV